MCVLRLDRVVWISSMEIVDEGAAYALVGPDARTFMLGSAQVLMRPDGTAVVITEAEEYPGGRTSDHDRREFVDVCLLSWLWSAPDEDTKRWFLRHFEGLVCRVLLWTPEGLLDLGGAQGGLREVRGDHLAVVRLDVPASMQELDWTRRLLVHPAEPTPIGWLEHVRTDRSRALREFVEGWFPRRLRPSWRAREQAPSPVSVPTALEVFYDLAHHPALLEHHDYKYVERPAKLELDEVGRIMLGWGGDYDDGPDWRIVPDEDDPQVLAFDLVDLWGNGWDESLCDKQKFTTPWRERELLSGFLLQFALYAAAAYVPYRGVAEKLSRRQALELVDGWQRVPLQPLLAEWEPVTFAVAPGRIALLNPGPPEESNPDVDDCWVSVAATHPDLLNPLDVDWYTFIG